MNAANSPYSAESLADVPEGDLVRRLLADSHWRSRILQIHGIPRDACYFPEVLHTDLGQKGDIDILVLNPTKPEFATAIQVKRVKVSASAFHTEMPNGLKAVRELHRQASVLVELGFWQVFSYVFVVVDSRERNQGAYAFDGLSKELRELIGNAISPSGLDERAGFIEFEITQPIDDVPLGVGTFFGRIHRMPTVQAQPLHITDWVCCVTAKRNL